MSDLYSINEEKNAVKLTNIGDGLYVRYGKLIYLKRSVLILFFYLLMANGITIKFQIEEPPFLWQIWISRQPISRVNHLEDIFGNHHLAARKSNQKDRERGDLILVQLNIFLESTEVTKFKQIRNDNMTLVVFTKLLDES